MKCFCYWTHVTEIKKKRKHVFMPLKRSEVTKTSVQFAHLQSYWNLEKKTRKALLRLCASYSITKTRLNKYIGKNTTKLNMRIY